MKPELSPAALAVLHRVKPVRRDNEIISSGQTFCDEAAAAKSPLVLIVSNGSRFAGEEPADLRQLLDLLAECALDPQIDADGDDYINAHPISCVDEKPLLPRGWVWFTGNFYRLAHCFQIVTNDPAVIREMTLAIRANQQSADYATARADKIEWKNRRIAEQNARRKRP